MTHDQFLTTAEVIDYLQVNLRTVYRLLKAEKLPAVRVGRQWRFRKRDLDTWLDRRRSAGQAARVSADASAGAARPRVLVAGHEANCRQLLCSAFSGAGYAVDAAEEGPRAVEYLRKTSYDLLVTEIRMPGATPLEIAREARASHPDLPIIVVTGTSTEAAAIEAIALHVSAYLTTPFDTDLLLAEAAKARRK